LTRLFRLFIAFVILTGTLPVSVSGQTPTQSSGASLSAAAEKAFALGLSPISTATPSGDIGLGAARHAPADGGSRLIKAIKIVADWSQIERKRGQFVWKALDESIAEATREKLDIVLVPSFTPAWASIADKEDRRDPVIVTRSPPRRAGDWERFIQAAARRYKDRVKAWQVWTALELPHFRGLEADYLSLLATARKAIGEVDRSATVLASAPRGFDLVHIRRMLSASPGATVSIRPVSTPESWLRPLAALRSRILKDGTDFWVEWSVEKVPESADVVRAAALVRAFGASRLFITPAMASALDDSSRRALDTLAASGFAGYLVRSPGTFALVFGSGERATLAAWTDRSEETVLEVDVQPGASIDGATAEAAGTGRVALRLSSKPVLVVGLAPPLVEECLQTLRDRGPPLPAVVANRDFSNATEVTARLGGGEEQGLYHILRDKKSGAVEVVQVEGEDAVRTNAATEALFVYFDVADTFLFFNDRRFDVEITVEVLGASAPQTLGFNIFYDSADGYKFSPWQWVEAKEGWMSYKVRLTDANFADTWGWDFAVNAGGARNENLTVRSVTVRKVPR